MDRFFSFRWLTVKPREWAISASVFFSIPSAGRDKCLAPGCGVARKVHGRGHRFVEKKP